MHGPEWYAGVIANRRRWAVAFRVMAIAFVLGAVCGLGALIFTGEARFVAVTGWGIIGALYASVHVAKANDQAESWVDRAKSASKFST